MHRANFFGAYSIGNVVFDAIQHEKKDDDEEKEEEEEGGERY